MQIALKISFWFSVVFAVSANYFIGDAIKTYLIAALFAWPGLFIQNHRYQIAAAILCCLSLGTAFLINQHDQAWNDRLNSIVKDAHTKKSPTP